MRKGKFNWILFVMSFCITWFVIITYNITILDKRIRKLKKRIKETNDNLAELGYHFSDFIDIDRKDKSEIIRAICTTDINAIIYKIKQMTWQEFADSVYYAYPSNYTYEEDTLKARTMLYLMILDNHKKDIIKDIIEYINNSYYTTISLSSGIVGEYENLLDLVDVIGSKKAYVNALENYLKENWNNWRINECAE